MNYRFNTLESVIIYINILDRFAHTGNHCGKILDVTHLLDVLYLFQEIVEVKFILLDLLLNPFRLFLVIDLLRTFGKLHDIAHAEDTVSHTLGIELLDILKLLTGTDIFDGLVNHRTN